jgi:hypothetical protein
MVSGNDGVVRKRDSSMLHNMPSLFCQLLTSTIFSATTIAEEKATDVGRFGTFALYQKTAVPADQCQL